MLNALLNTQRNPHPSDLRIFCACYFGAILASLWRDDRGKYNTRKGNTLSRLCAVVESRRPYSNAALLKHTGINMTKTRTRYITGLIQSLVYFLFRSKKAEPPETISVKAEESLQPTAFFDDQIARHKARVADTQCQKVDKFTDLWVQKRAEERQAFILMLLEIAPASASLLHVALKEACFCSSESLLQADLNMLQTQGLIRLEVAEGVTLAEIIPTAWEVQK